MRSRNAFFLIVTGFLVLSAGFSFCEESHRPNIVIVIGDDCTFNDLPLYGGKNVQTPHIDLLAREGMTFNHAYVSMAMCSPCRAELYTGLSPFRNGVCWNYVPTRTGTKSIAHYLRDLGYRVGIAGKIDVRPQTVYPFEEIDGLERSCIAETADFNTEGMKNFVSRNSQEPFCLIAGLVVSHIPWTVGDPSHFDLDRMELPANLPDIRGFSGWSHMGETKSMREYFAAYLAEVEVLDQQVGEVMRMLKETGHNEDTLLIFTSEQGSQMPGNKYTNYDTGVHTGFIVRWPGRTAAGTRTDAIIQYMDVLPTLIDAVGGNSAEMGFSGSSFLSVLLGKANSHRDYAHFMHNNLPEGTAYPIRAVTDGTVRYIRNLRSENLYTERHIMSGLGPRGLWNIWMWWALHDDKTEFLLNRYMNRPFEEFYDTERDPYELKNLVEDARYSDKKNLFAEEVSRWMESESDPGAALDEQSRVNAAFGAKAPKYITGEQ